MLLVQCKPDGFIIYFPSLTRFFIRCSINFLLLFFLESLIGYISLSTDRLYIAFPFISHLPFTDKQYKTILASNRDTRQTVRELVMDVNKVKDEVLCTRKFAEVQNICYCVWVVYRYPINAPSFQTAAMTRQAEDKQQEYHQLLGLPWTLNLDGLIIALDDPEKKQALRSLMFAAKQTIGNFGKSYCQMLFAEELRGRIYVGAPAP